MLSPYRVLDLTDTRAQLGPMILADLGAEVIRIEPPGGDASREAAPIIPGAPAGMGSLRFHAFNRGKKSVTLDLETEPGRATFFDLVRSADFLVENAGPGVMTARGIGFEALKAANPSLVYVAISPFGQEGPYANHLATDLTLSAMGGMAALNGEPDRPPVRVTIPQTWHHGAAQSAIAALVAHQLRMNTGEAQFVDVSVQAAVTWTAIQGMGAFGVQGKNIERAGTDLQLGLITLPLVSPAADGDVVMIPNGSTMNGMLAWLREDGLLPDSWEKEDWSTYDIRLLMGGQLLVTLDEVLAGLRAYTARHTKHEMLERGLKDGVTVAPVAQIDEVLGFRHLEERGYWRNYELPGDGSVRMLGAFTRPMGTPLHVPEPAPKPGEHNGAIAAKQPAGAIRAATAKALPFEGLKVADFSWIGVGPLTARYFADHGATVVRVETTNPPDRLRSAGPFKDGMPGANRSQFFAMANASKKGVVLDLKSAGGKEVAKELLAWCDVAFESFTPGTMADLGLDYAVAKELNPDIIMVSTCLMGQTGPAARLAGYGYHAAAISGFYELTGWPDRGPAGPFTAYTDIIAPHFLSATVVAALDHHRRTGDGQYIEQAQMESALYFLAPELLEHQVTGVIPRRSGNADPNMAPHSIYPAAGTDRWIAIACETDEQWQSLVDETGIPELRHGDFATTAKRLVGQIRIDGLLGEWTAKFDPHELMTRLQAAGVPAGVVQKSSDLLADPQLAERGYFRPLEHSEMGMVAYEGHQFRIAGYDNGPRFAAPCLGEHTFEVLTELLGMDEGRAAELMAAGGVGI